MALVILKDGRSLKITKEQGHDIWAILQGDKQPDEEQAKFVESISKLYLNFNNAPDSYISEYLDSFTKWCKSEWPVDASGKPTRPYGTKQWSLAKKWGIVK